MNTPVKMDTFIKNGLKLLRCTKDPSSIKTMLKHMEEAVHEQYGGKRRPTNAAKNLAVPTILLSKTSGIEQTEMIVDDESRSLSSSSNLLSNTSKSIVKVYSSPPHTITSEQAKSDPVINIDSDFEMKTENIESYSCSVCKDSSVKIRNNSVECSDCHSVYHKNCHTLPITDINLNDPRTVWSCSICKQKKPQKLECSSRKRSKKSSSKTTSGTKLKKLSSSKTSQTTPSKSKYSTNSDSKHNVPIPVMYFVENKVQMIKKKAAKTSEKK